MYEDRRKAKVRELIHAHASSPSLQHIRDSKAIDRLVDEVVEAVNHQAAAAQVCADQNEQSSAALEPTAAAGAVQPAAQAKCGTREEYGVAARQRVTLSTAELTPLEAVWRDLFREQVQELKKLREAIEVQSKANEGLLKEKLRTRRAIKLMELFDRWAALPGRHEDVANRWRVYVGALASFIGHGDAARLERADLIRWRNYLRDEAMHRGKRLSAKTINDSYLAAINAVFAYAVGDGLLLSNPMDGVTKVIAPKAVELRDRDLTKDEALTILRAAAGNPDDDRRWLPWLMAYTGTRVGEPAQLRKEDVLTSDGIHVLRLTPDAGPIKNRKARLVPIHSHLVALGFLDFVAGKPEGPLFGKSPAQIGRRVGDWVRSLGITAPQPNHCWRHTFKTAARAAGIPKDIADRIQGHAASNEGSQYGTFPMAILREAIERIAKYEE